MSGVFSIHNAAPPIPATAWPTTMVAVVRWAAWPTTMVADDGTSGRRGAGNAPRRPARRAPDRSDLVPQCSVPLARRDTPPLPVAPNRGHIAHFSTLTKGKLNTVFRCASLTFVKRKADDWLKQSRANHSHKVNYSQFLKTCVKRAPWTCKKELKTGVPQVK